jgi:aryl-alcohol dehydrogenase-like predicted oxidoreductase
MRYRPLGARGQVVSAVSLVLAPDAERDAGDWVSMIYAALECGVSGFEIRALDAALASGLAQALAGVDRKLMFVAMRVAGWRGRTATLEQVGKEVRGALTHTRLDYLDAVLMHGRSAPKAAALRELAALKSAGVVRALGVAGDDTGLDALVTDGALDLLATSYSLLSGWAERRRIRDAVASDMAVIGYGAYPREQLGPLIGRKARDRANPLAGIGGYGFLQETREWTPEELCLAYALTEPALATVLVRAETTDHLERLAAVADRDLPSGVAAQIEMARFSALGEDDARRTA